MADISIIARLVSGIVRNVDIASNTLVVNGVKVGGAAGTILTKAILDNLVTLQDGSDVTLHTHDTRYYTETEIGSSLASSGSDLVGDDNTYSNFTPAAATVKGALSGIDTALATAGGSEFGDDVFRVTGSVDATKKIALEADGLTTATTRTITMPDSNVNLGDIAINTAHSSGDGSDHQDVADLATLSGSAANSTNHGAFTGTTLSNTETTRSALQALETAVEARLLLAGGTMSGAIAMGSNKITGLADGIASTDAVNKGQLDSVIAGIDLKESVRLATSAALPAYTAAGTGVGKTLTANAVGILTVDGVATVLGDRIIVKDEAASHVDHGIYEVTTEGTAGVAFILTRATDADQNAEVTSGMFAFVKEGTSNNNTGWAIITSDPITVDTTAIQFSQFQGLPNFTASLGVELVGNDFRANLLLNGGLKLTGNELGVEPNDFAGTGLEDDGADNLRLAAQGNGIAGGGGGGTLSVDPATEVAGSRAAVYVAADGVGVNLDNSTLDHSFSTLQVKSGGIGETQLNNVDGGVDAQSFVLPTGYTSGAGIVAAVDTIDAAIRKLDGNNQSTQTDLNAVKNNGIASADGSVATSGTIGANNLDLSVNHAPKLQKDEIAGETLTAGIRALRWGKTADGASFAGRVYLADKNASIADDFHVMGVVVAAGEVAAATISGVVKSGDLTATAHGFTVGEPIFLSASGALTATAPSAANEAVVKIGMAKDANTIDVQIQIMGVN